MLSILVYPSLIKKRIQDIYIFQKITKFGLKSISSAVETMAEHEGLDAHKNAVSIRINSNES